MRSCIPSIVVILAVSVAPGSASEFEYSGPALVVEGQTPFVVDNSHFRYTGSDMLSFDSGIYIAAHASHLTELQPAIDTWAAQLGIHPRILIHTVGSVWLPGSAPRADDVYTVATGLAQLFWSRPDDPLAASKAVLAVTRAHGRTIDLPAELGVARTLPQHARAPEVFGVFQPPWEIGDTWAGGGAHGDTGSGTRNALDFWGSYRPWGSDVSQWWVASIQSGTARVWSSCSVSVVHANGWTSSYYHLENVQVGDHQIVARNTRLANYADDLAQATCNGGSSSGPHLHMAIYHNGVRVEIDEANLDFTSFSHHAGVGQYDTNCSTSWYNHFSQGTVCPNHDQLLNDASPPVFDIFSDGFESGDASWWSSITPP